MKEGEGGELILRYDILTHGGMTDSMVTIYDQQREIFGDAIPVVSIQD
jgi:hypothetical protein